MKNSGKYGLFVKLIAGLVIPLVTVLPGMGTKVSAGKHRSGQPTPWNKIVLLEKKSDMSFTDASPSKFRFRRRGLHTKFHRYLLNRIGPCICTYEKTLDELAESARDCTEMKQFTQNIVNQVPPDVLNKVGPDTAFYTIMGLVSDSPFGRATLDIQEQCDLLFSKWHDTLSASPLYAEWFSKLDVDKYSQMFDSRYSNLSTIPQVLPDFKYFNDYNDECIAANKAIWASSESRNGNIRKTAASMPTSDLLKTFKMLSGACGEAKRAKRDWEIKIDSMEKPDIEIPHSEEDFNLLMDEGYLIKGTDVDWIAW